MPETMPETVEKDELLRRIENGYKQFEAILAPLSAAQMMTPEVNGSWSVKDNLAHLTVWQDYLLSQLQGILNNQEPPEFMPGLATEDEINERIYQQNKDRSLAEVQAAFRASYQRVLEAVQAMSAESLNAPSPWSKSGNPLWPFIVGNTYGHYEEHGGIIQRWLARPA
ncbi:MAG TPA: ClbS/DfsB family four-helix bundle protein [Ktedonobacterales bacterium]